MWPLRKLACLGVVSLTLSACATGYEEPAAATAHANFVFQKSVSSKLLFRGTEPSIVTYQVYKDVACTEPNPAANFGPASKKEKTLRFNANTAQRMVVNMVYKSGDLSVVNGGVVVASDVKQHNCIGLAKFTPQQGHSYSLSGQSTEVADVCILNVVDMATGVAPVDLLQSKTDVCQ